MTRIKRKAYRILSMFVAFLVLCSTFTAMSVTTLSVGDDMRIVDLSVEYYSGSTFTGGVHVWDAPTSDPGHLFSYRINFSLSGNGEFDEGEIRLTIPTRLLKDRNGDYADKLVMSIPSVDEVENYDGDPDDLDISFVYEIEGDKVVVYNYAEMSAATTEYIEMGYSMSESTFEYKDMAPSDDFIVNLAIMNGTSEISSRTENAGPVYINTGASIIGASKNCQNIVCPYDTWQSEWGTAPENANDYYFLVWTVSTSMGNATQPYRFTIDDTMTEPDAEPVAYKFWGMSKFTTQNYIDNVKLDNETRYDYVVTRHLKATYKEQDTYRLHNKAVVTAYPIDGIDDETTASASAEFLYKPVFIPPPGNYISRKAGNSNWWQIFKVMWQVADYGLDDLKDGTVDHLNSNIHFKLEGWAEPYPLTVISTAEGDELADIIESYAKRKVTMVLTDEDFYFNDGIYENSDRNIVISDTDVKIGYQDYSIDYVDYSIDMKDAVFDRMLFRFVPTNVTLTEEDVVTFYAKFRDSDEWVLAGTYNMFNGEKDYNTAYVKSITGGRIEFAENCVAYKMETRNCHYHTHMTASPYCRIKNSDYIMSQIEGKERVWLTNVSNYSVYDDDGHLEFSQDSHATDFIIGVVKDSVLKKEMIIRTDSTLKRNVSLRWRITMNEFFVANYGREDIPQETGTFYDLLPLGLDLDISTVGVFADGGFLSESDYEATQINNYNDTGRTMLRIYLKDQFQNVAITYETVYSWDDIFDYGDYLLNSVVYETGNKNITKGRGDDGGNIQDSSLLADIDPDTDDERFLYAERGYEVDTLLTVTTSLNKRVQGEQDPVYKKETKVNRDEPYKYKLRYATTPRSRAKDLILYDKLEGYKDDNIESQWKGSLLSVDTAQLRMQDAAPVVYCSLMQDVQIDENTTLDDMVDGERVWIPASQLADINDVTAIAVDIRKKRNGQDFVLEANKSIVVVLYMNSPMFDETNSPDPVACNNIYLDGTTIDEADNEEDYFIDYGYTTVHYRVTSSFGIIKTDSKEKDQPIKGISFTLQGVSDYGTSVNITRTTDKNGKLMFENIERGSYTFYETDGSDDYLPVTDIFNVEIDGYGNVTINDTSVDNRGYYYIEDDPRVHADIEFMKRDFARKSAPVIGAEFILTGTSNYGNSITRKIASDELGKVAFKNIEWGTYDLYEVNVPEGYIPNETAYAVTVDDSGFVSIRINTEKGAADEDTLSRSMNGLYYIYNEPYHSFNIQKLGQSYGMPVEGAVFAFEGTSDLGTSYHEEKTTPSSGRLSFSGLESGVYTLTEISAPEGYALDDTPHIVTITKDGSVTITGSELNSIGQFIITDKENSTITVTKIWEDNETNETREAVPVINLRTDLPTSEAYFGAGRDDYTSVLNSLPDVGTIKSFAPFNGDDAEVQALIASGDAVRIDDGTTACSIYAWFDTETWAVKWWSDAKTVYLTDKGRRLWYRLYSCESIDVSNINTSKMSNMSELFSGCYNLHYLDLSTFDTSIVVSMYSMFSGCSSIVGIDLSSFDTSNVSSMKRMFYGCNSLTELDLSNFNVEKVVDMTNMFMYCSTLETLDLSSFRTKRLIYVREDENDGHAYWQGGMFKGCTSLTTLDLSNFDTSCVCNMTSMFEDCSSLKALDLSSFDTSNLIYVDGMFADCDSLETLDLSSFDTSSFYDRIYFDRRYPALKTVYISDLWTFDDYWENEDNDRFEMTYKERNVSDENAAYFSGGGCTAYLYSDPDRSVLARVADVSEIKSFSHYTGKTAAVRTLINNGTAVRIDDKSTNYKIYAWFNEETGEVLWWSDAKKVYLTQKAKYLWSKRNYDARWDTPGNYTSIDVSGIDTSKLDDMSELFSGLAHLTELDLSSFDTSNVKDMSYMFNGCSALTSIELSSFDTSNVLYMNNMFQDCSSLTGIDLSGFDTSNVVSMAEMFSGCSSLTEIDLSGFDTSNAVAMDSMFSGCSSLTDLDLSSFNIWNVTTMNNMFYNCEELVSVKMPSSYTGNVSSMDMMFSGCEKLAVLDLSAFDTSNVTSMYNMFANCPLLRTIYVSDLWSTDQVTGEYALFIDNTVLTGGNGTEFISENNDKTYARVDKDGEPGYFTYKKAEKKWTVFTSKDKNCELKKLTDTKWTYTFSELVPGLSFVTYEDELEGYTSDNMGPENAIAVIDGMAAIVNRAPDYDEPAYGSLKIKKTVEVIEGDVLTDADTARKFVFNVELKDDKGNSPVGTELFGTVIFRDGKATVRLASGESVTIPLRAGWTYKVTEKTVKGYECFSENAEGTIAADTESLANFKNIRTVTEADEVSFKVKKIVTGTYENDLGYRFNIVFTGLRENESYTITNGEGAEVSRFTSDRFGSAFAEFALHNEEEVTVNKIPAEATYVITEEAGDYISSFEITDENELDLIRQTKGANTVENKELSTARETADKGESVTVTFTNKRDVRQNVTLKKVVVNDTENDDDEDFIFDIELAGLAPEETIAISTAGRVKADEEGKISLKLPVSGGQTVVFYDLPAGATYKFTEQPSNYIASFRITDSNDQGKITDPSSANKEAGRALSTKVETVNESEDVTVTFTNKKSLVNITVTKIWDDNKNNRTRTAKPVMHLSYEDFDYDPPEEPDEPEEKAAYFEGYGVDSWSSYLNKVASPSSIISFAPFEGDEAAKQALIDDNKTVRIDDNTTNYKIYAYFNEETGALRWWTDADKAYLTDKARFLWSDFYNAEIIDATGIDTSLMTNMSNMFRWLYKLNTLDVSGFDTSNATTMNHMFCGVWVTGLDLRNFDTSNVTDMESMFFYCTKLKSLNVSSFDTSNVKNMWCMFEQCESLTSLDLSNFNTSQVTDMEGMFRGCKSITSIDISRFDTRNVTRLSTMFSNCTNLRSIDVSSFDTRNVKLMSSMFYNCNSISKIDLRGFVTSNVTGMNGMFENCYNLSELYINSFDTRNVTHMNSMFSNCYNLTQLDVSHFITSNATYMNNMFYNCYRLTSLNVANFDTSNVKNMSNMFYNLYNLSSLDVDVFDTGNVTNMSYMFYNCYGLTTLDISNFATRNVTDMSYMFYNCQRLSTIDVSSFVTSKVTNMSYMFYNCYRVTLLALKEFDTSQVTNMTYMFYNCYGLSSLDLSSFQTNKISSTNYMFYNCNGLTSLHVSSFDMSNVMTMSYMFAGCRKLKSLDLSSFNTSKVTNMYYMFNNCVEITKIYVSELWNTDLVTSSNYMFLNDTKLKGSNGTSYSSSYTNKTYARIDKAGQPGYFTYKETTQGQVVEKNEAYFIAGNSNSYYDGSSSLLNNITSYQNIRSFAPFTGDVLEIQDLIDDGIAVRIDNQTTKYKIYGWYNSSTGAVEWWSDAEKVYLTDASRCIWAKLENCVSIDTTGIDTSLMKNMGGLFYGCYNLKSLNVDTLDTSSATNMMDMFSYCRSLKELDLSSFDTSNVTDMCQMFNYCNNLEAIDVTGWNTSNNYWFENMFADCYNLKSLDVSGFDTSNAAETRNMFYNCGRLETLDVSGFDMSKVREMDYMFYNCYSLTLLDVSGFNTSNATSMRGMFSNCSNLTTLDVSSFDTKNVTSMDSMFANCSKLTSLDVSNFDTSNVTYMRSMFQNCNNLTSLNVSGIDLSSVTSVSYLFSNCSSLKSIDLSDFSTISLANKDMSGMFYYCSSLKSLDLSNFDTSSITNMSYMFYGCRSLETLDLSSFDTSKVTNMSGMFGYCTSLRNLDITTFDTSDVTNMYGMFNDCSSLKILDLDNFDTSRTSDTSYMFNNCQNLETIYVSEKWNNKHFMNSNSMFTGDEVLEGGYGTEYDSNYTDMTYAKIDRSGSPGYLTYKTFTRKQFNLSSEDPGCIVTKLNNKQWTYTFTRIPADLEYFVWEEGELEDYESENIGEANKLTVVNNKAIITNTAPDYEVPTFGSLKISKTVVAAEDAQLESVDTTRKFSFSITLYDKDGISPYGTETYGKVVFNNGKATLRLSHGESVTIDSIPTGYTYKVDEGAIYGFVSSADSSEGTIAEDTTSEVNYVNTKQPKERQNVSFKLKKAMTGSFEIAEDYSFTIAFANLKKDISYRISDSKGSTVTRFTPDENKEAVVALTMTNGDEFTVNNIPEDTTYKITEAAGAYTSFYEITDAKSLGLIAKAADENTEENNELSTEVETADAGEEVTVLFTNVKNVYQDITLKKSLVNAAPGNTDKFSFLVELWGLSPEEVISTDSDAEVTADETGKGTLELTLAADEEIVIKNLPVGSTYRITEAANDYVSSYTVTDSSGGNKIVSGEDANEEEQSNLSTAVETVNEGENVTVEFINTKVPKRDLTIAKLVDMSYGTVPFSEYSQQSFSFTASFTGLEAEKRYNTILTDVFGNRTEDSITADTEGEAEFVFRLSHGGTVKILDLTEGAQYTVTEERAANYAASYGITANDTAVIAKTADNNASPNLALSTQTETVNEYDYDLRVIFTNTYEMPGYVLPDTGLDDMRPFFAIAFSFMILFAGVFSLAVLRKREEQKQ